MFLVGRKLNSCMALLTGTPAVMAGLDGAHTGARASSLCQHHSTGVPAEHLQAPPDSTSGHRAVVLHLLPHTNLPYLISSLVSLLTQNCLCSHIPGASHSHACLWPSGPLTGQEVKWAPRENKEPFPSCLQHQLAHCQAASSLRGNP